MLIGLSLGAVLCFASGVVGLVFEGIGIDYNTYIQRRGEGEGGREREAHDLPVLWRFDGLRVCSHERDETQT